MMKKALTTIRGAGGSADTPQAKREMPNNIASTAYFRILDLICEGEIAGLVNEKQSIFLDDTPLANPDGSENFEHVTVVMRTGTQDQGYVEGFDSTENEISVGVELKQSTPWVRTISDTTLSAIRITITTPAGLSKATTTDATYSIEGLSIRYSISVSTDGGAYSDPAFFEITGKTSSSYQRSQRIDLPPATSGWTIQVTRNSPNADSSTVADTTVISSYTEIVDGKMRYPNSAIIGIMGDAQAFSSIPRRGYECFLRIIQVPSNYDAETRVYTGVWDGTFKPSWTDNPAWCFYDLVTNKRFGLGHLVDETLIDKWALYKIAQYCDGMVSDGHGGTEPRFTCNIYTQGQAAAYKVLSDMTSIFRGIAFWTGGTIMVNADMSDDPTVSYVPANVIDGKFTYVSSPRKQRYTVALVSWVDPRNAYKSAVEYCAYQPGIDRYGIQQTEVTAIACTSQGQAQRLGHYITRTASMLTETVTFGVGLDGIIAVPGQLIAIADPLKSGKRAGGRIKMDNGISLQLDQLPDWAAVGDVLTCAMPDGTIESHSITDINGAYVTVGYYDQSDPVDKFSTTTQSQGVWTVESSDTKTLVYRVVSVKENKSEDTISFSITAVQHDHGIYSALEEATATQQGPAGPHAPVVQLPVTDVAISEDVETWQGVTSSVGVITWTAPADGQATKYLVSYRRDDNNQEPLDDATGPSAYIHDAKPGDYVAQVIAVSGAGKQSVAAISATTTITGKDAVSDIITMTATGRLFAIDLAWAFPTGVTDTKYVEIRYGHGNGSDVTDPKIDGDALGQYAYPTSSAQLNNLLPSAMYWFAGKIVDNAGNEGPWSTIVSTSAENPFGDIDADVSDLQAKAAQLRTDVNQTISDLDQEILDRGAAITTEQQTRSDADSAMASDIALIGVHNAGKTSFVLNQSTTKIDGDTTLGQYITGVTSGIASLNQPNPNLLKTGDLSVWTGDIDTAQADGTTYILVLDAESGATYFESVNVGAPNAAYTFSIEVNGAAGDEFVMCGQTTVTPVGWSRLHVTGTADASGNVTPTLGATDDSYVIRRWKLEAGSVATPFDDHATQTANSSAISALQSTTTQHGTDISTNASDITALQSDVTGAVGDIAANSSAITGLQTDVATNAGNISTNASAITALESKKEPTFDAGMVWKFVGSAEGWAVTNQGTMTFAGVDGPDNGCMHWLSSGNDSNISSSSSNEFSVDGSIYTSFYVKLRMTGPKIGKWQGQIFWYDAAGHGPGVTHSVPTVPIADTDDWQIVEWDMLAVDLSADGAKWAQNTIQRIRFDGPANGAQADIAWIAIGRPSSPAAYADADRVLKTSIDANAGNITIAAQDVTSIKATLAGTGGAASNYASAVQGLWAAVTKGGTGKKSDLIDVAAMYSLTLDVNGYVTGWSFANNGTTGSAKFNADSFEISKPGGGARTEYSDGNWRIYDASGTLRIRMGIW